MLDNYDRGEVTPPPVSSYGGSPGLLALHSSLYATPTSRTYDIDTNIDTNDSTAMPIDTQIISVRFLIYLSYVLHLTSLYLYIYIYKRLRIYSWTTTPSWLNAIFLRSFLSFFYFSIIIEMDQISRWGYVKCYSNVFIVTRLDQLLEFVILDMDNVVW